MANIERGHRHDVRRDDVVPRPSRFGHAKRGDVQHGEDDDRCVEQPGKRDMADRLADGEQRGDHNDVRIDWQAAVRIVIVEDDEMSKSNRSRHREHEGSRQEPRGEAAAGEQQHCGCDATAHQIGKGIKLRAESAVDIGPIGHSTSDRTIEPIAKQRPEERDGRGCESLERAEVNGRDTAEQPGQRQQVRSVA